MDKLKDILIYLENMLGLRISTVEWIVPPSMPVFLRKAADYFLCSCDGIDFIVASARGGESLPDLKRISNQLARYTELSVALASNCIDSRQRKALVSQGIPFIVPGKQAYLPFLGFVAQKESRPRVCKGPLSARAQAAFVTLIANPFIATAEELCAVSHMSRSSITRAVDELACNDLIERGKNGRNVTIAFAASRNKLLRCAMPSLSSPVVRTFFVEFCDDAGRLPNAGVSALADRSMLAAPAIVEKAVARTSLKKMNFREVVEGELEESETVEVQVWKYKPLVAGLGKIDNASLALSLAAQDDERILGALDGLFGEEGLWQ